MEDNYSKVDRLVSIDVAAKFEALQDEVDLLKNEIKQTLVDLREFLMKDRTIFPQLPMQLANGASTPALRQKNPVAPPAALKEISATLPVNGNTVGTPPFRPSLEGLDTQMLSNFIAWLGSVKDMGLTLQQVTPYLEAYESSGYLQPVLLKVILRSMADVDQLTEVDPNRVFSSADYATCVGQLHRIICESSFIQEQFALEEISVAEYTTPLELISDDSELATQYESGIGLDPDSGAEVEFPTEGEIYSSPVSRGFNQDSDMIVNQESTMNQETNG